MESRSARNTGPTTSANAWRPSAAPSTAAMPMTISRARGKMARDVSVASAGIIGDVAGSDTFDRIDSAVLCGLDEGLVVLVVLVGVLSGEFGDRLIDLVSGAEVGGD